MSMISPQYFTSTNNNTFPRHVAIGTSNSNTIYSTPNNSLHLVINSQEDYNSYVSIEFKKHMRRVQFKNEIIIGSKIMQTRIKERESVNKISEWFLNISYDPKYKYCHKRLNSLYDNY